MFTHTTGLAAAPAPGAPPLASAAAAAAKDEGWLHGVRFGMASAVISAVVLVLTLRPLHRFRVALVASLLTIALVDSMADGYALFNAAGDVGSALASIAAKLTVCGSLAALAYLGGRGVVGRSGSAVATPASRRAQLALYGLVAAFVVGQLVLTSLTSEMEDRFRETALLVGLFVAAVLLSILLNKLVSRLER
jgi:hypothetical protein